MKWYYGKASSEGVVLSSRVRLARNLESYPFPRKCSPETKGEICSKIKNTLEHFACERFNYINMENISPVEKASLTEDHLISREFCDGDGKGKLLITDEQNTLSVMVNEEDHLRIQSIMPGLDITGAYEKAVFIDDIIAKGEKIAFDEKLGYLTSCPTNLGTGMRASVMLHLPAITSCGQIKSLVSLMTKIGLTVRGLYGEGSEAEGCLYQVSNQITLGVSEKDAIEKLTSAVSQIVERERQLRETLLSGGGLDFEDSICRSYGILRYAKKLSSKEFLKLWSDVKFGVESGVIRDIYDINLTRMLVEVMPAHILSKYPEASHSSRRDEKRAEIIKNYLM
jgi:protein arginine kinase